jgi:hypothetical protein
MSYKPGTPVFMQFLASAVNVFAAFTDAGIVSVKVSGFGGGGGGGGGCGGENAAPNTPGPGGGGAGSSLLKSIVIDIDMSHQIDVVVGAGGLGGAGGPPGAPGGIFGGNTGGSGGTTYLVDQTAAPPMILAAFAGGSGAVGGTNIANVITPGAGGVAFPGSDARTTLANTFGFVAAGSPGRTSGASSFQGNPNDSAIGTTPATPLWPGGAPGNSPTPGSSGGAGGGGGAGVGGPGGFGGTGVAAAVGGNGGAGGANTGAGGGGGAGGGTAIGGPGSNGGNGGDGGSGLMELAFMPPK